MKALRADIKSDIQSHRPKFSRRIADPYIKDPTVRDILHRMQSSERLTPPPEAPKPKKNTQAVRRQLKEVESQLSVL